MKVFLIVAFLSFANCSCSQEITKYIYNCDEKINIHYDDTEIDESDKNKLLGNQYYLDFEQSFLLTQRIDVIKKSLESMK